MKEFFGVAIVTRNHAWTIGPVLDALAAQEEPADRVVVVDCASDDRDWAQAWRTRPGFEVELLDGNLGFTGGNNAAWRRLNPADGWVLFLNPDVIVPSDLFRKMRALIGSPAVDGFGAIGVRLMGWDFGKGSPTGEVDSMGIFPTWNGWRDRREPLPAASDRIEGVPGICGAFFLGRVRALREVAFRKGEIWDERYFAYKEDIELSLRLQRAGWKTGVWHGADAWHGRGWQPDRKHMSREARLLSARNELRLHAKYAPWKLPVSVAKWTAVRWLGL